MCTVLYSVIIIILWNTLSYQEQQYIDESSINSITIILIQYPLLILVQGPKINENENEIYEIKEIISFFSR